MSSRHAQHEARVEELRAETAALARARIVGTLSLGSGEPVRIELRDGRVLLGDLVRFDGERAAVRPWGVKSVRRVRVEEIRHARTAYAERHAHERGNR